MKIRQTLRHLKSFQRLDLGPSDVLVVEVEGRADPKKLARIKEYLDGAFPGHKVIIVDESIKFSAIGVRNISTWEDK